MLKEIPYLILTNANLKDNINRILIFLENYPKTVQEIFIDYRMSRVIVCKILKKLYSERRVRKFYRLEGKHKFHVYAVKNK